MSKTIDLGPVKGTEGKTAYQYAQEGGYTGTEAEFQTLMAAVPTHASDTALHISATAKETVADADSLVLSDSADGGKSKRVLWSKVKALLGAVFAAKSHTHTKSNITDFPSTMAPSAHAASHASTGADPLTPAAIGAAVPPTSVAVTLTAAGWDTLTLEQTVAATGVLADETKQLITPCPAAGSRTAYYDDGIIITAQAADSLTFTATVLPTENLTVYVVLQGVGA